MSFHPRIFPWLNKPNPVPPADKSLIMRPGPRWSPHVGHSHVYQPQPFPGAPAFAYETLGLVEFSPIGPSVANRDYLLPLAKAGTIYSAPQWFVSGLGGLVSGQVITQPLLYDPNLRSENLYQAPGYLPSVTGF